MLAVCHVVTLRLASRPVVHPSIELLTASCCHSLTDSDLHIRPCARTMLQQCQCRVQALNCTKTVAGETVTYPACASLTAVFNGGYDLYWTLNEKVATILTHRPPRCYDLCTSACCRVQFHSGKSALSTQILRDANCSTRCDLRCRQLTRPIVWVGVAAKRRLQQLRQRRLPGMGHPADAGSHAGRQRRHHAHELVVADRHAPHIKSTICSQHCDQGCQSPAW